jgi:hypothetical protein
MTTIDNLVAECNHSSINLRAWIFSAIYFTIAIATVLA